MTGTLCHVNLAKSFRGGERQTELLVGALKDTGWQQRVVLRRGNPLAGRLAAMGGIDVREVTSSPLAASLATRGAALVHAHEARAVYAAGLARLCFGIPYLFTRRVDNPLKPSRLRDWCYRRAAAQVAVSRAVADIMRAAVGVDADVVMDAHASLGHDPAASAALRERYSQSFLIGHVGALDDGHKGQRTLFEIARRARDSHPDWAFVLLGDGRDEAAFRQETADLDNVYFEGFVDNVGDYLAALDLFVFPSRHEAVGSSLLDAMQFGLAIVASRVGGIPEVVSEGHNGILCPPGDAEAFETALSRLYEDVSLREAIGRSNVQTADGLSAARMGEAYTAIYRRILDGQSG